MVESIAMNFIRTKPKNHFEASLVLSALVAALLAVFTAARAAQPPAHQPRKMKSSAPAAAKESPMPFRSVQGP